MTKDMISVGIGYAKRAIHLRELHDEIQRTLGMRLPERLQRIADRFNGRVAWLFQVFDLWAGQAGELRRERNEARASLREWEAMTPNRLRLRADMMEEEEARITAAVREDIADNEEPYANLRAHVLPDAAGTAEGILRADRAGDVDANALVRLAEEIVAKVCDERAAAYEEAEE